jgi:hypothetical protein
MAGAAAQYSLLKPVDFRSAREFLLKFVRRDFAVQFFRGKSFKKIIVRRFQKFVLRRGSRRFFDPYCD